MEERIPSGDDGQKSKNMLVFRAAATLAAASLCSSLFGTVGRIPIVKAAQAQNSQAQTSSDAKGSEPKPKATRKTADQGFQEPDPLDFEDHSGYTQIFDGLTLKDWVGDPSVWRVEKGAIVGESTKEKPVGNSYISYHGVEAKDFDLKLEIKVENGGGSGIQYRSKTGLQWRRAPADKQPNLDWMMTGPQADFWYPAFPVASDWTGQFYSENTPLGILAWRGEVVESGPDQAPRLMGNVGSRQALGGYVKVNDWNQYLIMARGGTFLHVLNGQLMAVYIDDDPKSSNNQTGMIGIEIENSPSKVSVRNVWLKKLD